MNIIASKRTTEVFIFCTMALLGGGLIVLISLTSIYWFYPTTFYAVLVYVAWNRYFSSPVDADGALTIEEQGAQEIIVQSYLDYMERLLLDEPHPYKKESINLARPARARTLTLLERVGPENKRSVVRFLQESHLVRAPRPIIDLYGADLRSADLHWVDLREACLNEVDLRGAILATANLSKAQLTRTALGEAILEGANLSMANLEGANLFAVDLKGANLEGANLEGANLEGANLEGANLFAVDLKGANLEGANLEGANLSRTHLSGANFSDAYLSNVDLSRTTLSGAKGVLNEELEQQVKTLKGTIMPNGQKYEDWLKSGGGDGENDGP